MTALLAAALLFCSAVDGCAVSKENLHTRVAVELVWAQALDGDTLVLATGERIRVMGVDTPELACRCPAECEKAEAAKSRTAALIAAGISLERHGVDKYQRVLAVVRLADGRSLAAVLISEKLGREYHGERRRSWCDG